MCNVREAGPREKGPCGEATPLYARLRGRGMLGLRSALRGQALLSDRLCAVMSRGLVDVTATARILHGMHTILHRPRVWYSEAVGSGETSPVYFRSGGVATAARRRFGLVGEACMDYTWGCGASDSHLPSVADMWQCRPSSRTTTLPSSPRNGGPSTTCTSASLRQCHHRRGVLL